FDQLIPERNGFTGATGPTFQPPPLFAGTGNGAAAQSDVELAALQDRVDQLIRNYRVRGHMMAQLDPLERQRDHPPELDLDYYSFTEKDLDRPLSTLFIPGENIRTLRQIYKRMRNTYCRSIGVQFMHISDVEIREWLQRRMEGTENRVDQAREEQLRILTRLTDAVIFERFLHTKYVGAKTFSLEGAESLVPLLDLAIEKAADQGVAEIVLGMAHRGRLNVLANVLGKSPRDIFREFEDVDPSRYTGRGDVKYHLGYSNDWVAANGRRLHLSLCFNPSHLEYINPVAVGRMRAKQDRCYDREHFRGMVVLIHGDAGFAGEGVVQETLSMSELPGYSVGGTLHVIVNNQIGFTTNPADGRSTEYATDVARMLQSPIFHVNGEDPEAVAQVVRLAMDFRARFQRDVVIDMYCYRKYGHNEGDEPSFTQPTLYSDVAKRKSVRDAYLERLLRTGVSEDEAMLIEKQRTEMLEQELSLARSDDYVHTPEAYRGIWSGYQGGPFAEVEPAETGLDEPRQNDLLKKLTDIPAGFNIHRKLRRYFDQRREMADGGKPIDWATAEAMAIGSLSTEGHRIRMSGQDCIRGTFSHRHSTLYDQETGQPFSPFQHLGEQQGPVEIYNSPLNEAGVLGFEYGYSLDCPEGLIVWEAQFGDFVNAAQVIIDQFIASAEDKWHRLSGLVMLLPHGFEGQGPEHSSARLERFLTLAAEDNIQI
ncbi:MAG: 2-oxoglutarate dehydrogenase E1 component, partial [Phycisphaeraceae bacterium]